MTVSSISAYKGWCHPAARHWDEACGCASCTAQKNAMSPYRYRDDPELATAEGVMDEKTQMHDETRGGQSGWFCCL